MSGSFTDAEPDSTASDDKFIEMLRELDEEAAFECPTFPKSGEMEQWLQGAIQRVPALQSLEGEDIATLAQALQGRSFEGGEDIVSSGDEERYFVVVYSGRCVRSDGKLLDKGKVFGEGMALHKKSEYSVTAQTPAEVFLVEKAIVRALVGDAERRAKIKILTTLMHSKFADGIVAADLPRYVEHMKTVRFEDGEYILKYDAPVDYLYLIMSGEAKAIGRRSGMPAQVGVFRRGDTIGGMHALDNTKSLIDAQACGVVYAISINRQHISVFAHAIQASTERNRDYYLYHTEATQIYNAMEAPRFERSVPAADGNLASQSSPRHRTHKPSPYVSPVHELAAAETERVHKALANFTHRGQSTVILDCSQSSIMSSVLSTRRRHGDMVTVPPREYLVKGGGAKGHNNLGISANAKAAYMFHTRRKDTSPRREAPPADATGSQTARSERPARLYTQFEFKNIDDGDKFKRPKFGRPRAPGEFMKATESSGHRVHDALHLPPIAHGGEARTARKHSPNGPPRHESPHSPARQQSPLSSARQQSPQSCGE